MVPPLPVLHPSSVLPTRPSGGTWCVCTRLGPLECQHEALCEARGGHIHGDKTPPGHGEEEKEEGVGSVCGRVVGVVRR